jgi:pimeloyl-ACP methyl ester carboxylesterase
VEDHVEDAADRVVTSSGPVETVVRDGPGDPVMYFHGGHESAVTAQAAQLYVDLGHRVVIVSRPGYGRTDVGRLSPAEFAAPADEVRAALGIDRFRAVVGTSFGGPQAIEYAGRFPAVARSLILHSAAPSTLPYPDSRGQRIGGPLIFHPRVERYVWAGTTKLITRFPRRGLRSMMAPLSTRRDMSWLDALTDDDRDRIRTMFTGMRSGSGFVTDLAYAGAATAGVRRRAQQQVMCPTLVTASHQDQGVGWAHAEDYRDTIPNAQLIEVPAASHVFWIGPTRDAMLATLTTFLAAV